MMSLSSDTSREESVNGSVVKIVMLGQAGCGKTSIVMRYIEDTFTPNTCTTIGAAFFLKTALINNKPINIRLWDTSGQERFQSLIPLYYRYAAAALLVFDPSDTLSLSKLKYWQNELENNCEQLPLIVIVANKIDLDFSIEQKSILLKVQNYAKQSQIPFFQTSAKTGESIQNLFRSVLEKVVEEQKIKTYQEKTEWDESFVTNKNSTHSNKWCC
ncbi:ras family-domain-containing protein [Anaeramoeba flamelloides]|uniref:Ras family-domain-containing protein n=1 Tax=Anaeramoeba flamelloides TaxID=1746091 RepID=A0ABQ8YMC2_9EUKA|nr:ras family-domain-containing protein [Anaeramoeba flamelloides]